MKAYSEYALAISLIGMLFAIDIFLGHRVFAFASVLAGIWFVIAIVLLSRPPGIPEFVTQERGSDEQHVLRRDVIPVLPWNTRLRLSLGAACGSCLILWFSLVLLAR